MGKRSTGTKRYLNIDSVEFDSQGLVAAIVQHADTGEVLTLAYMNRESLEKSLSTGQTWFFSRSRGQLWHKGETSGNIQHIVAMWVDCDSDALLVTVRPAGPACHTGERSCFHKAFAGNARGSSQLPRVLAELYDVILQRRRDLPEGSYTAKLFKEGLGEIAKKVGEEGVEVAVASLRESDERLTCEVGDLLYHLLVLLAEKELALDLVAAELAGRRK